MSSVSEQHVLVALGMEPLWIEPHTVYGDTTSQCMNCHSPHSAATSDTIFGDVVSAPHNEPAVCLQCHNGMGASTDVTTGVSNSFGLRSGHMLEALIDTTTARDMCNTCSDCHTPHDPWRTRRKLPAPSINGTSVPVQSIKWCYACHDAAQSWYTTKWGAYPALTTPTLDASGYPVAGTYPGATLYASPTLNAHSLIPSVSSAAATRSLGDCRWCHAAHRGPSRYDALTATFSPPCTATLARDRTLGDYAAACFTCHGGSWTASGAVNIKQYVTNDGTNDAATSGHRIKSATPSLPLNAPLPCYDCHNPHGSTRGNKSLIADTRGRSLLVTAGAPAAQVRQFCMTCHTTWDGPYAWNSVTATYYVVATTERVEGLRRDGGTVGSGPGGSGYNWLRLKNVSGHLRSDVGMSCYGCHGNQYGAASSINVHAPGPGVSTGGIDCYACHPAYKPMDRFDPARASTYHHVMGTSTTSYSGGYAPGAVDANYPTSSSQMFCVTCHGDHNYFNSKKAANLRQQPAFASGVSTNTDYSASLGFGGMCASCHFQMFTKDNSGNRTSDGSTLTLPVYSSGYQISAHQYEATSGFSDGSVFRANCSKCHNDEMTKTYQSGRQFGTHASDERHLLSAFGVTVVDPLEQVSCFGCHSRTSDGRKTTAKRDYWNASAMTTDAEYTQRNFSLGGSSHPVTATGGAYVTCEGCHNVHITTVATPVADPDNSVNATAWATTAAKANFCLDCHDGAPPVPALSNAPKYVASITIPAGDSALMNKSDWGARGHWSASGSIGSGELVSCDRCHDSHGSKTDKLLGEYEPVSDTNKIYGPATATITANDNSACYACHALPSAGYPAASRTASGYPTDGRWTGQTTYTVAYDPVTHRGGIHNIAAVSWPTSIATPYPGGDCKNCHDVHGSANLYDELRTESTSGVDGRYRFSPTNFGFCFNCHDANGPGGDDIAQFYPTTASGTANPVTVPRSGHRTVSTGTLPAGSSLPCYDCHNPHGTGASSSYGLLVVTRSRGVTIAIGDGANEIEMTGTPAPQAVRRFCFACHTSSDTGAGWTGTATQAVLATDLVEGISRLTTTGNQALRLPVANGHRNADTASCYQCHGRSYAAGGTNVHSPSGGVSVGGDRCYACHSAYKETMDAAGTAKMTSYHHVMGTSTTVYTGDIAPNAGTYPTSTTNVFCVSCHNDHNYFNTNPGANLRTRITSPGLNATNTDFITTGTVGFPGICLSCHVQAYTRDTNQKACTCTTVWSIDATAYAASPHNYSVVTTFGTSPFRANCSKCHNDDLTKEFQADPDNGKRIGTHWAVEARILAALGGSTMQFNEEQICYRCHSRASDPIGGTTKTVDAWDWYGQYKTMSSGNYTLWGLFQKSSRHRVEAYNGIHLVSSVNETQGYISRNKHVECADCHNHHVVGDVRHDFGTTNLVSQCITGVSGERITTSTANWSTAPALTWTTNSLREYEICFKCHSRANTSLASWSTSWTDLAREFNTGNQSYHPVISALPRVDPSTTSQSSTTTAGQVIAGWAPGDTMYCSDCHGDETSPTVLAQGPHGSSVKWLLRGPKTDWPANSAGTLYTINNKDTAGFQNLFCDNCHPGVAANKVHARNATHKSSPCVNCHILVPHGGGISRLLCDHTNMPARYAWQNNLNNALIESFTKRADPNTYARGDCTVLAGSPCAGGTAHVAGTDLTKENWPP